MLALLCLLTSTISAPSAELSPEWGNLEGDWRFSTDPQDVGEKENWQAPDHPDADWRAVKAPGYWEAQGITDPRPGQPPRPKEGMAYSDYDGVAWYRLRLTVPQAWEGQALILQLGSVDDQDRTYLNGELVGETGPGLPRAVLARRAYEVSPDGVRYGGENVLAVRVFDGGGPGGLMGPLLSLLPKNLAEAPMKLPQADRPLAERFTDPPAQNRILKIIHNWPDDPAEQDSLISSLISQGFGGVVCNVSWVDQYLESEEKWQAFVRAVHAAKDAGMSLWLYDEDTYPSGTAGGITLRGHPEWQARGLLVAEATTSGGLVALDAPPGTLVSALAFPLAKGVIDPAKAVDLAPKVQDGKLSWEAPAGEWRVLVTTEDYLYEGTHSSMSVGDRRPDINLLMPEPTARFIEVTHDQYAKHLGDDLGRWFVSSFTDEPSLMSLFMRPMPYRVLPWAPNLPVEFRRRRGHDLEPLLPLLVADAGGPEKKARYDFWLTVGELVSENFFGQIEDRCRKYNLLSGGHPLMEESLLAHVSLYGDFFRCTRRLSAPSIDCLTSLPPEVPWYVGRLISSAAELEGNSITMSETSDFGQVYRPQGDERPPREVTPAEIRGTCNRLMANGITTITSYYSFRALGGGELRDLNDWVGRCSTMITGGHQVTDLALVYPTESVWPRFVPARQGPTDSPAAAETEQAFYSVLNNLYAACRDFIYVDSRTLAEAKVESGALVHGPHRWRVVILPGADTLPLAAWENLARFWREGGVIISVAARPANSETDFPSPRVQALAEEVLGPLEAPHITANAAGGAGVLLPRGSEGLLARVLDALLEADVRPSDPRSPVRATHRRIDDHEVYFAINDSPAAWEGTVKLAAAGAGELWDPATGKVTPLPPGDEAHLSLEPYGGALLRFPAAREPKRLPAETGPLPGLTLEPFPPSTPEAGKGEFVRAEVTPDAAHSQEGKPAWRAVGTITKGQTDTFLFLILRYPQGLDLSAADSLAVETWVPDGQTTSPRLLIILHEKDGGQYIAETGRPLGAAGYQQSFVPLSRFAAAGWAKDPDDHLDLASIDAVNIGWGGYLGAEGERIEFTLALPQTVR